MRISIVGTGHIGLTTGVCLASIGHQVVCVDIVPERVAAVNSGRTPFYEPGLTEMLSVALSNMRLHATTELAEAVLESEVTFITVGTPQMDQGIDLSYVTLAARQIGSGLRYVSGYHVVAVKSTVVPGTTDTLLRNILEEASGRRAGEFGLCMSPEFLREGSAINDFMNPDRIVIGQWNEESGQVLAKLYESFDCPKILTTLRNAEMIKYASNALLATLISFSNEIAELCEATPGTDVDVVMDGLHLDRRLSPIVDGQRITPGILSYLRAGCGFGGSCLPKDVNALRVYAREVRLTPSLLDAVMAVNIQRPARLVRLAEEVLGSLHGRTVTVLGLAFKPGTDDLRDSPALAVIDHLLRRGATVRGYDPKTLRQARLLLHDQVQLYDTPESALSEADVALICTAWPEFTRWDWDALARMMRCSVIIDGRNVLRKVKLPRDITYLTIGRKSELQPGLGAST